MGRARVEAGATPGPGAQDAGSPYKFKVRVETQETSLIPRRYRSPSDLYSVRAMGIFSDWTEQDPLSGRAESLVSTASALAEDLFSRLATYYPDVFAVRQEDWDFLVTAAGLYVASLNLYSEVPDDRLAGVYEIVERKLPPGMAEAMHDCSSFITRRAGVRTEPFTFETVLGYWVLMNALPQRPTEEQAQLAFFICHSVTDAFASWWQL